MRPFVLSVPGAGDSLRQRHEREQGTAIRVRITIPAYTRGVWSWLLPSSTSLPRPSSAPAHSPNTAPMTDTVAAIFSPLKNEGSAAGASTLRSVRSRDAPNERISLSCSRSARAQPVEQVTVIGKKQISATMASLGPIP